LGVTHHRIYKKEQRKTLMGKIHRYLGPAIIFFGLVNGGIGFSFAGSLPLIPYSLQATDRVLNIRRQIPRNPIRNHHPAPHHPILLYPLRHHLLPQAAQQARRRTGGFPTSSIRPSTTGLRPTPGRATGVPAAVQSAGCSAYEV
jgi:hypothetical protein